MYQYEKLKKNLNALLTVSFMKTCQCSFETMISSGCGTSKHFCK